MERHPDTWLAAHELGQRPRPYRPTFAFEGDYVDDFHRGIAELPRKDGMLIQMPSRGWRRRVIPGWLLCPDALKLYEMAYFAGGDVLELGSYHGLSAGIMGRAIRNEGRTSKIETVDLEPASTRATRRTVRRMGLRSVVRAHTGDALQAARSFIATGRRFPFVFVDHSHAYGPVHALCGLLGDLLEPGGFCLFHDFNDPRNGDPHDHDYGVYAAVLDGLDPGRFDFFGVYGCAALYRRAAA